MQKTIDIASAAVCVVALTAGYALTIAGPAAADVEQLEPAQRDVQPIRVQYFEKGTGRSGVSYFELNDGSAYYVTRCTGPASTACYTERVIRFRGDRLRIPARFL